LQKKLIVEVAKGIKLRNTRANTKPRMKPSRVNLRDTAKENRQRLMHDITHFSRRVLKHISKPDPKPQDLRERLLGSIRERKGGKLRQVVGRHAASALVPPISHIVWKGKRCFGVTYRDIHPLLLDHVATRDIVNRLAERHRASDITVVVGLQNEGSLFFAAKLAAKLHAKFAVFQTENRARGYTKNSTVPIESLLGRTGRQSELCAAMGMIRDGDRCLIIDEILDNGTIIAAAESLACALGGYVVECVCILELMGFGGRERMENSPLYTLLQFDDNRDVFKS